MTSRTRLLASTFVVAAAVLLAVPSANAVNFGPVQFCASWTGGGPDRHTCAGDPFATVLELGSKVDTNSFCFGNEARGDDTLTAMLPGTGVLSFRVNLKGVDSPAFDWFFFTVGGVTTRVNNPDPFVCDNGNNINVAAPDLGSTIVLGVHQDAFGDPLCATVTNINT